MTRNSAYRALDQKLAADPSTILNATEIRLPNRELHDFESAPMGNTWVVDMRHYLDQETGDLPESLPNAVLNLALFFGSIVVWVTDHLPEGDWHTNVPCRRSPGRKRCLGEIFAELDRGSGHIVWHCSVCGDNGLIHGWEDTFWNRQGGARGAHACSSDTPPTMSH